MPTRARTHVDQGSAGYVPWPAKPASAKLALKPLFLQSSLLEGLAPEKIKAIEESLASQGYELKQTP